MFQNAIATAKDNVADRFATDSDSSSPTFTPRAPLIPWMDAGRSGDAASGLDGTAFRPGRGSQASRAPDESRKAWCGAAWPPTSATSRSPLPACASPWRDDFETRSSPVTMTGHRVCYYLSPPRLAILNGSPILAVSLRTRLDCSTGWEKESSDPLWRIEENAVFLLFSFFRSKMLQISIRRMRM